jgi:hypothetical protein
MRETLELVCGPIEVYANPENYGSGVESYLRARYASPSLTGDFDWYFDGFIRHFEPFIAQMEHYPLKEGDLPLLELFSGDAPGLRMIVEPVGRTGELELILQMNEDGVPDNMLRARTKIAYATLQRLANELRKVIREGSGSVEIELP